MKAKFWVAMGVAATLAACINQETQPGNASENVTVLDSSALVQRGAYLVAITGCNDCHTPKIMTEKGPALDMSRLLSGHGADVPMPPYDASTANNYALFHFAGTAARGPWGVSFAANLTPDATGIGNWNEKQFITALRHGKAKGLDGGRPLLPPMPWEGYSNMTDEDLRAVFAYLKSIPAVSNIVPAPIAP